MVSLIEGIRKNLDEQNIACGIFVDLQKAFDTVEHDILSAKLEHCGIHGLANEWFRSCVSNRKQYVSIGLRTSIEKFSPSNKKSITGRRKKRKNIREVTH